MRRVASPESVPFTFNIVGASRKVTIIFCFTSILNRDQLLQVYSRVKNRILANKS